MRSVWRKLDIEWLAFFMSCAGREVALTMSNIGQRYLFGAIVYQLSIFYSQDFASASYAANGKIRHAVPSIVGSLVE